MRLGKLCAVVLLLTVAAFAQTPTGGVSGFTDNFTRSDASTLGSGWTIASGGAWGISSNTPIVNDGTGFAPVYVAGWSYGNDQYSSLYVSSWTTFSIGPAVRIQAGANSGMYLRCRATSGANCSRLALAPVSGGSAGSAVIDVSSLNLAPGNWLILKVVGSSYSVFYGSTQIGSTTSNATFSSGNPGMMSQNPVSTTGTYTNYQAGYFPTAAATPTFSPDSYTGSASQSVTISTGTTACSSKIYWSTTHNPPTTADTNGTTATVYSATNATIVLYAKVIGCSGYSDSAVGTSGNFVFQYAPTPTIYPAAGSYLWSQYAELNDSDSAATIYYTTDGSTPTTSSTQYTGVSAPTISASSASSGSSCGGPYKYFVTSTNASGESSVSNEYTISASIGQVITVTWAQMPRATGYKVYRTASGGGTGTEQLVNTIASGSTVSYSDSCTVTPSGALPTYNTSAIPITSGTVTVKAIAVRSGYGNSAVLSATIGLATDSSALYTDNGSNWRDANFDADGVPSLPLDDWTTNFTWKINGAAQYGTFQAAFPVDGYVGIVPSAYCTGSSGYCFGAKISTNAPTQMASGYATTYIGSLFSSDQWAETKIQSGSGGVCTRCSTTGEVTGYVAYSRPNEVDIVRVVSGTATTLRTVNMTVPSKATLRLRSLGSNHQLLVNGSVAAEVIDSSITAGNPGIFISALDASVIDAVSDFSAGGVGNTTFTANTPGTISYTDFTDCTTECGSSWKVKAPYFWGLQPLWTGSPGGAWKGSFGAILYDGGKYGIGLQQQDATQYEFRRPTGNDQFVEATILVSPWDVTLNNWLLLTHHYNYIPGLASGDCAAAGVYGVCFDQVSNYIGISLMYASITQFGTGSNCASLAKNEYTCTPFYHFTQVNDSPSSTDPADRNYCAGGVVYPHGCDNVITRGGSFFTPLPGDKVRAETVGAQVRAYCYGGAGIARWQANHAYAQGAFYLDVNGNYQRVTVAGTSGATEPTSLQYGFAWFSSTASGETVTSGTMTSEYVGSPCPSTGSWSLVFTDTDNDLSSFSKPTFTGLWAGQGRWNGQSAAAPVFTNIKSGTVTNGGLCTTLPSGCGTVTQPFVFVAHEHFTPSALGAGN